MFLPSIFLRTLQHQTLVGHAGIPGRSLSTIAEGEEPEAFWSAVGGMGEYPEVSKGEAMAREPRLFHVSNATGKLSVVLVCNFDQSDLCADDVMLLDTFASVFVWVGAAANEIERAQVSLFCVWCLVLGVRCLLLRF